MSNNHQGLERAEQWLDAARASIELYGNHPVVAFADLAAEVASEIHLLRRESGCFQAFGRAWGDQDLGGGHRGDGVCQRELAGSAVVEVVEVEGLEGVRRHGGRGRVGTLDLNADHPRARPRRWRDSPRSGAPPGRRAV